ncbi:MAG: xanthine dehydrogenase family protein subunit M [Candidatus Latescibacteria bacterium]|nr:xanthine dehydrogenase family protein subunit M [Candidatus Latescibacterota bacterium]
MKAFEFVNPSSLKEVPALLGQNREKAVLLAGGIDLLGELKEGLIEPDRVVNLKAVSGLNAIKADGKGLRIGALTTLAQIEGDPTIQKTYKALADAAASVGSVQIRNVGTLGGNLCQRPRCWYYRGEAFHCLKKGGSTCFAVDGNNKYNAILGGGPSYIVHPSDTAPALIALNAKVTLLGPKGSRTLPLEDFFVLPGEILRRENVLAPDEIVTEVEVPAPAPGAKSVYLKFQEKDSMDFALSAVAVALTMSGDTIRTARVVLGGVAPKPWPAKEADALLVGQKLSEDLLRRAADAALAKAQPLGYNDYKVPLTRTLIQRAVMAAAKA